MSLTALVVAAVLSQKSDMVFAVEGAKAFTKKDLKGPSKPVPRSERIQSFGPAAPRSKVWLVSRELKRVYMHKLSLTPIEPTDEPRSGIARDPPPSRVADYAGAAGAGEAFTALQAVAASCREQQSKVDAHVEQAGLGAVK